MKGILIILTGFILLAKTAGSVPVMPPPGWAIQYIHALLQQNGGETILNPTTNSTLKLRVKKDYEIFDAKGKLVKKGSGKEIDVSDLPAGKYTVKFDKDYNQIEYFKKI